MLRRAKVAVEKAKKTACLVIQETNPLDIVEVLKKWEHNPKGVLTAIQQELDGSLNYTDVDIWMWLKAVLPKKGYTLLQQQVLKLFSKPGHWASLVQDQAYVIPKGDMLQASVKLWFDAGAQKLTNVPFKGLAKWLGQCVGMTKDHAQWVEAHGIHTLSGEAHRNASLLGLQQL